MLSLADAERRVRDALVDGDTGSVTGLLVGGGDPTKRLAIHQRHYEASLTTAIIGKYPATGWLVGSAFLAQVAREFVLACPPTAPCIAEYGAEFPRVVARRAGSERLPYLKDFAALEWNIGQVSIAIDAPSVNAETLAAIPQAALPDVVLRLQPGLRYLEANFPVDALMRVYMGGNAPETYAFTPAHTFLEIRGARGAFDLTRLDAGEFVFRRDVFAGSTIGNAAEHAFNIMDGFDPGASLSRMIAEGLVTAVVSPLESDR